MAVLLILLILLGLGTFFIVIGDMFRKKIWLGILGLLFFPLTFVYAFTSYSGRRLLVGSTLWLSFCLPYLNTMYQINIAENELKPFIIELEKTGGMSCSIGGSMHTTGNTNTFDVYCNVRDSENIQYSSVNDLVKQYKYRILEPVIMKYKEKNHHINIGFTLGILSPSKIYACYKIEPPGEISDSWNTGETVQCD
jgi:hypothetical protein